MPLAPDPLTPLVNWRTGTGVLRVGELALPFTTALGRVGPAPQLCSTEELILGVGGDRGMVSWP